MLMAGGRDANTLSGVDNEEEPRRTGRPGPVPTEQFVGQLLSPYVARLDRLGLEMGKDDQRFRRSLSDFLEEIEEGLTPHVAGRAVAEVLPEISAWFDRLDAARAAQRAEFQGMLQLMGKALKAMQGGDEVFMTGLDNHLDRIRTATGGIQVRTVSQRLETLINATVAHAEKEREKREQQISSLSESIRGLHQELEEVRVQMAEDPLTGLYNRGTFDSHLESELAKARLAPYRFSLVMIDLDHFKAINDTHLHVGGDRVLIECARVLQRIVLRKSDLCARYGGEEMAVLLADCDFEGAASVAESIRVEIEELQLELGTGVANPTASLGVTSYLADDSAESMISRADRALYRAKRSGRNQVQIAQKHQRRTRARVSIRGRGIQ